MVEADIQARAAHLDKAYEMASGLSEAEQRRVVVAAGKDWDEKFAAGTLATQTGSAPTEVTEPTEAAPATAVQGAPALPGPPPVPGAGGGPLVHTAQVLSGGNLQGAPKLQPAAPYVHKKRAPVPQDDGWDSEDPWTMGTIGQRANARRTMMAPDDTPEVPSEAPQGAAQAADVTQILDMISAAETPGKDSYNATWGHKEDKDFSKMRFADVMADSLRRGKKYKSGATGRYQFMGKTLGGLQRNMGISDDEPFTHELQDKMAIELMREKGLDKYQSGEMSAPQFMDGLAQVWMGLPKDSSGAGYHMDKAGNKPTVGYEESIATLNQVPMSGAGSSPARAPGPQMPAPGPAPTAMSAGPPPGTGGKFGMSIDDIMNAHRPYGERAKRVGNLSALDPKAGDYSMPDRLRMIRQWQKIQGGQGGPAPAKATQWKRLRDGALFNPDTGETKFTPQDPNAPQGPSLDEQYKQSQIDRNRRSIYDSKRDEDLEQRELDAGVMALEDTQSQLTAARVEILEAYDSVGGFGASAYMDRITAGLPLVGDADDQTARDALLRESVDATLRASEVITGAMTEGEWAMLAKAVPKANSSRKTWEAYFDRAETKIMAKAKQAQSKAGHSTPGSAAPATTARLQSSTPADRATSYLP